MLALANTAPASPRFLVSAEGSALQLSGYYSVRGLGQDLCGSTLAVRVSTEFLRRREPLLPTWTNNFEQQRIAPGYERGTVRLLVAFTFVKITARCA